MSNTKPRVEPQITTGALPEGFTPPAQPTRGGGNASKYPFDDLEVGGAFGVKNKTRRQMLGPVRSANLRFTSEAKDAEGNVVNKTQDREFYAVDVDDSTAKALKGTPLEGSTVLVVRKV